MPYVDDLMASGLKARETFSATVEEALKQITYEEASLMFPDVKLNQSQHLSYFPFRFCHSLPSVNGRGRAFTPATLQNSFASMNDQLIDWEHYLESNGTGKNDRIIGHVKATRFEGPAKKKAAGETASSGKLSNKEIAGITEKPFPAIGLGALFLRAKGVDQAIDNHVNGTQKWKTSMECGHLWKDAWLLYRDELIPLSDAELGMKDCIKADHVLPYRSHELAVCLGGLDGKVDFWGLGFTTNPADSNADIFSFVAGHNQELASKKIFYMPFYGFHGTQLEVASKPVDKMVEELASIGILGETDACDDDGHSHYVLSNLSVIPSGGHAHTLGGYSDGQVSISRGSNPTLTGVTDLHTAYHPHDGSVSSGKSHSHRHMINIPLKGKYKEDVTGSDVASLESTLSKELEMKLTDVLAKLDLMVKTADPAKATDPTFIAEMANLRKEVAISVQEELSEEGKKTYLESQVKAGKILSKEAADQLVADAVKEANDKAAAELKAQQTRHARLESLTKAGINLDAEFEGIKNAEGKQMTLRNRVEMIPTDEAGDALFGMDMPLWASNPALKLDPPAEGTGGAGGTTVVDSVTTTEVPAETASNGTKKKVIPQVKAIAGAGPGDDAEKKAREIAANKSIPSHLQGRRAISARK